MRSHPSQHPPMTEAALQRGMRWRGRRLPSLSLPIRVPRWLETVGVVAAVLLFGVGWARVEQQAAAPLGAYPAQIVPSPTPRPESPPTATPPERPSDAAPGPDAADPADSSDSDRDRSIWLVDGFNLMHAGLAPEARRGAWWAAASRERLLERVSRFGDDQAEIWVVFDGPQPADPASPPGGVAGRVRALFAPSADAWLVQRVRGSDAPERLALVTADRQLADRARHRGARVVSPREFLDGCV